MGRHISGHRPQRRVFAAAAATASVLMAVSAPVANAAPGSGDHTPKPHTPTAPAAKHVSGVQGSTGTSTAGKSVTSGSQSTVLHNLLVPAVTVPAGPDPGINIGNPPPGMPGATGNTNYGAQTNPNSVQIFNLGTGNNNVANNTGTVPSSTGSSGGPGVNLVNLGNTNNGAGNQTVNGASNFGFNAVSGGNGNISQSGSNLVNNFASSTSTGLFSSNLAFIGSNNTAAGASQVEGSNSAGVNVVSVGNGNQSSGLNWVNAVDLGTPAGAGPAFGANYATVGNNTFAAGINDVTNTGAAGTFTAGVNNASVGDNATRSGSNSVFGANTFGANYAVVMSTTAAPTVNSGHNTITNTVTGSGLFGANFAFVGAGSSDSGNNTAITTSGATSGGFNMAVIAPGQTVPEGNNTGGGINIAILPGATGTAGNCAKAACINLFGMQLL